MLFHRKIELCADTSVEETAEAVRKLLKDPLSGLHGTEEDGVFLVDYKGRGLNAFRPDIRLQLLQGEDGCLLWADMQLPRLMYAFMAFWTILPIGAALFSSHHFMPLLLIPVFWLIAVFAFRSGVKSAKTALMTLFGAYELTE